MSGRLALYVRRDRTVGEIGEAEEARAEAVSEPLLPTDELVVDVVLEEELFVDDEPAVTPVHDREGEPVSTEARLERVGRRYGEQLEDGKPA